MPFSKGFLTQIINYIDELKYKPAQVVNGKIQKEKK